MNEDKGQKWFAYRTSTTARTDEDAAMAYKSDGPFATERAAIAALIGMLEREIAGWKSMNMDPRRDERALARVRSGETDVTEGGVRWRVAEITGNPPVHVAKWQCDVHGVTVARDACCSNGRELGAYLLDERVGCAHCEEPIVETGNDQGRAFGRTTSNGPICMPCMIEGEEFAGQRLTDTQIKFMAWILNPSKDAAHAARRAKSATRAVLVRLGFLVETNTNPYYAATIMGRKFVQMRVRDLPLVPYAVHASNLVRAAQVRGLGESAAEVEVANELDDAIERRDRAAQAYHRSTIDAIAGIKAIVVAAGGSWN